MSDYPDDCKAHIRLYAGKNYRLWFVRCRCGFVWSWPSWREVVDETVRHIGARSGTPL